MPQSVITVKHVGKGPGEVEVTLFSLQMESATYSQARLHLIDTQLIKEATGTREQYSIGNCEDAQG